MLVSSVGNRFFKVRNDLGTQLKLQVLNLETRFKPLKLFKVMSERLGCMEGPLRT